MRRKIDQNRIFDGVSFPVFKQIKKRRTFILLVQNGLLLNLHKLVPFVGSLLAEQCLWNPCKEIGRVDSFLDAKKCMSEKCETGPI